jgi:hypothetical protein
VSRSYDHDKDYIEKVRPDYMDELASRDMINVDDQGYTGVTLEEEEDEQWANDNPSTIASKISVSMAELERMQEPEVSKSDEVLECLKNSLDCYQECTETLTRCTAMGDKHSAPEHLNRLMDCARICVTNADFMLRNSNYYQQTCGITANICDECSDSCDMFEEDFMKQCANVCRRCAESCREMVR